MKFRHIISYLAVLVSFYSCSPDKTQTEYKPFIEGNITTYSKKGDNLEWDAFRDDTLFIYKTNGREVSKETLNAERGTILGVERRVIGSLSKQERKTLDSLENNILETWEEREIERIKAKFKTDLYDLGDSSKVFQGDSPSDYSKLQIKPQQGFSINPNFSQQGFSLDSVKNDSANNDGLFPDNSPQLNFIKN